MRMTCLILAIIGALCCGVLGYIWLTDYYDLKEAVAAGLAEYTESKAEFEKVGIAAYLLLVAAVLGIAGGVMVFKDKCKIAAAALLAGGVLPAVFAPPSLMTGGILILAAPFGFFARPKAPGVSAGTAAAAVDDQIAE